jgi:hypothetical protein
MSDLGGQPAHNCEPGTRDAFKQFKSAADLICTEECDESTAAHWLKGYRAYAVEQWLLNDRQPYWVVAERTSRDEDAICVRFLFPVARLLRCAGRRLARRFRGTASN